MVFCTLWCVSHQLRRLLCGYGMAPALDLKLRYREVSTWFARQPVYGARWSVDYPPVTYVLLWPWHGWSLRSAARWLWAATELVGMAWLAVLAVRESRVTGGLVVLGAALLASSFYPVSTNLLVGQLGFHFVAPLLTGVLMVGRGRGRQDLAMTGCLLALEKPTLKPWPHLSRISVCVTESGNT